MKLDKYKKSLIDFEIQDEVLKLKLIIRARKGMVSRAYVLEKLNRILSRVPIALDYEKQQEFIKIKEAPE